MSSNKIESDTPSSAPGLDPAIEDLVNRLVEARLHSSAEAWKAQETTMLNRETVMRDAIELLNAKLAIAQSEAADAQAIHRSLISANLQDSPMPLASGTIPVPTATSSDVTVPQKRRRKSQGGPPVPHTAPARNTRSHRQIGLRTTNTNPTAPAIPVQSHMVPVLPSFNFTNAPITQGPPPNIQAAPTATSPTILAVPTATPPIIQAVPAASPVKPAQAPKKKKVVVKAAAEIYRFLPSERPDDLGGLQLALALHIRILWGLLDAKQVPQDPPSQLLNTFGQRFSTEDELYASRDSGPELIPRHLVQIGTLMSSVPGRIANQARLMEEHMLCYVQACLAKFGLNRWCPDLRLSAYALYNAACRIVALDTFKQALISHAYAHLVPNTAYTTNLAVLIRLYDHFVYHYMQKRYLKENRLPGSVLQELQATPQYQARKRLAAARLKFLVDNRYPQRYRDLIDAKATSDDELDSIIPKTWNIKRRPERSIKAERFIRILDQKREETVRQDRSRRWRERLRVVPAAANQQDSLFRTLPEGMPVDYFNPDFFNSLQPQTRNRVAVAKVSMLEEMSTSLTWSTEERISDEEFTKKHGPKVFSAYWMVADADVDTDIDDADEWIADDEDESEDESMSDVSGQVVDTEFDISSSRNSLTAHLSGSMTSVV